MIKSKIKKIFLDLEINEKIVAIKKINDGITNENYLVITDNNKYVLRFNNKAINRENEIAIVKKIEELEIDVKLIYLDENIKISQYIENVRYIDFNNENDIKKVSTILNKLHNSGFSAKNDFDPIKKLEEYKNNLNNDFKEYYKLKNINQLLAKIKNEYEKSPKKLCHNDLVKKNLLFKDERLYLIDYEYCGNNNVFFDLASFISENNITDERIINIFLSSYFGIEKINPEIFEKLNLWIDFSNVLWLYWSLYMYQNKKDKIFLEIALLKYNNLNSYYKDK